MITASSLLRLMQCPGSTLLPRAENISEWADAGHEEHEELQRGLVAGTLPDWIAALVPAGSRPEVALAFDVATGIGRVIGENLGRSYGVLGPFEICGSCDVLGIEGDAVVVIDYKTGHRDVESAATNPQLAFYALAAARALGKHRAIVRILYTKTEHCDEAELDALDLAAFAAQLVSLHRRVAQATATKATGEPISTKEGAWCRHCASKPYCGSKNALLAQVATGGLAVIGDVMTPERAASAYEQIVKVEQLVTDARKRLVQYVEDNGPIMLPEGRAFGRYFKKANESLDARLAVQAIREVTGEQARDFEAEAVDMKVTKAGIKRAAQKFIAVGAGKTEKAVLKRLDDLGGIKRGDTYPIGEVAADKVLGKAPELADADAAQLNRALEAAS